MSVGRGRCCVYVVGGVARGRRSSPDVDPPRVNGTVRDLVRNFFVFPDDQMPQPVTLWWGCSFLDRDLVNLVIVGDYCLKAVVRLGTTRPALQGIHNIFKSVVHVVPTDLCLRHIEGDCEFQFVRGRVASALRNRRLHQFRMDGTSPFVSSTPIRRNSDVQCLSSFPHIILDCERDLEPLSKFLAVNS